MTVPRFRSLLSQPVQTNNFIPVQSAQLGVSNSGGTGSASVTFTVLPGTDRTTFKITNSGQKGCYVATGVGSATAIISVAGSPRPAAADPATVANCDYVAAGAIITQDYVGGTDTIAAICAGSDTTTLEVTVGYGQ